eukprot:TRINITY_DN8009_c0_g4_i2.p1 TRINITY_DN8009_c0_g4~~TRINITY_DN8009_c0_g4_i2.p1  ORF type:complete len:159 (-),score=45.41 TRINITY_DN8009_c0_g4_i2:234-710(-)
MAAIFMPQIVRFFFGEEEEEDEVVPEWYVVARREEARARAFPQIAQRNDPLAELIVLLDEREFLEIVPSVEEADTSDEIFEADELDDLKAGHEALREDNTQLEVKSPNAADEGAPEPVQVRTFGCTPEEQEMIANETFLDRVKFILWELSHPFGEPED